MKKTILSLLLASICLSFLIIAQPTNAGLVKGEKKLDFWQNLSWASGVQTEGGGYDSALTLDSVIGRILRLVLSIVGLIFVLLIFLTGNDWMQAAGNEEKVRLAKSRIQSLLIGLTVILIAFALSYGFSTVLSFLIKSPY